MDHETRVENEQFEEDVRRIARARWPQAEYGGSQMINGRETDGIFETDECIHAIEATTSRTRNKASQDIEKLIRVLDEFRPTAGTRALCGWFITRDDPTVEQRQISTPYDNINVLSFSQFQMSLIDTKAYLSARTNYAFGSVRDPATGKPGSADIKYIPLGIVRKNPDGQVSLADLVDTLSHGSCAVLLGDYGAGKSMTLREIYRLLRRRHLRDTTTRFPVYINLRDHYGQNDPAEVLTRHARQVGFASPSQLVRAWRAGYVHLLVDGFDEVAVANIQGLWRKLRETRYRAMEVVRRLIQENPLGSGCIVAGRAHFFDSREERQKALFPTKAAADRCLELSLDEFNDQQIAAYLDKKPVGAVLPSWLPSRPLLIGYLAVNGILQNFGDVDSSINEVGRAQGWDLLLDMVSDREAEIDAGIDGQTIRKILERLATKTRTTMGTLGSISPASIIRAFRDVCGYEPGEESMVVLQRLPGLGVDHEEEGSRAFLDSSFADSCKAGDLVKFIEHPYGFEPDVLGLMESEIGELGIEVASWKTTLRGFNEGKMNAALSVAQDAGANYLVIDLIRLLMHSDWAIQRSVIIDSCALQEFELSDTDTDLSVVQFSNSFFGRVEVNPGFDDTRSPVFQECYINEIDGRVSIRDLPPGKFDSDCFFVTFSGTANTTSDFLNLDIALGKRVCLTILKKLYQQRGAGRRENALQRGLDHRASRLVPDVLEVLRSEGLAIVERWRGNTVWRPVRGCRPRVGRIISAPATVVDGAFDRCGDL